MLWIAAADPKLLECNAMRFILALALALASDWPQFRGPTGQGHSAESNLPIEWSEYKNVIWKTPIEGLGWSSPVIVAGRVWLTTTIEENDAASIRAIAFDEKTGEQLVNTEVFRIRNPRFINPKNSFASPTPIVEDGRVYVHFGQDGTAALTTSGEIVWKTRLPYESQHGGGGSPALYKDLLIVNCDGADQAYIIALDKNTGKTKWKSGRRRPFDQAYSTPLVIRVGDRDQIVSVGAYRATAYEPESGKEIWRVRYSDGFSNVPRPVFGHGMVYIATGFQQPTLIAVRADGSGDVTDTHIQWTLNRGAPYTPSPLLLGDELYVVSDLGIAACLDARTGEAHWQARLSGNQSASPVFADGRIYFLGEEGVATVIAPGKVFRKLATNTLDGAILASMGVANGAIFIRTDSHLYRIGL
jgi:outer membrane protein assembly factor BamB